MVNQSRQQQNKPRRHNQKPQPKTAKVVRKVEKQVKSLVKATAKARAKIPKHESTKGTKHPPVHRNHAHPYAVVLHGVNPTLRNQLLETLLPAEAPTLHPVGDPCCKERNVAVVKTYQVLNRSPTDLIPFKTAPNLPQLDGSTPVWYGLGDYDVYAHIGDTRLLAIIPTIAQTTIGAGTANIYQCTDFMNFTDAAVSTFDEVGTDHRTIIRSNFAVPYQAVSSLTSTLLRRLERMERQVNGSLEFVPDITNYYYTYSIPDNTYIQLTDLLPVSGPVFQCYGTVHPPVSFEYLGEPVTAIWIDACASAPTIVTLTYNTFFTEAYKAVNSTKKLANYAFQDTGAVGDQQDIVSVEAYLLNPLTVGNGVEFALASSGASAAHMENVLVNTGPSYTNHVSIELGYSGYYIFKLKGSFGISTTLTSYMTTLAVSFGSFSFQCLTDVVSRHFLNHQLNSSLVDAATSINAARPLMEQALSIGSSLLASNVTPTLALGGYIEAYRQSGNRFWFSRTALADWATDNASNLNTVNNYVNLKESLGVYSPVKPNYMNYTRELTRTYVRQDGTVGTQLMSYMTGFSGKQFYAFNANLIRLSVINYSGSTQNFRITLTSVFQFTTKSMLFKLVTLPKSNDEKFLDALLRMPCFTENPFHFATFVKSLFQNIKSGVKGAANLVKEIAPTVGAVGSALSMVPDARVSSVGKALGEGASIADFLASRV